MSAYGETSLVNCGHKRLGDLGEHALAHVYGFKNDIRMCSAVNTWWGLLSKRLVAVA